MFNLIRRLDSFLIRFAVLVLRPKPRQDTLDPSRVRKVLCLKLWGLGNLAVIYPLLYKIKEKFPGASITFVTFDANAGFLEKNKVVEDIVYFNFTVNPFLIVKQFVGLVARFRRLKPDVLINFETFNNAGALLSFLTGARTRIGFDDRHEGMFYTHPVKNDPAKHISEVFSDLLKPLGIDSHYRYFDFSGPEEESGKIKSLLAQSEKDRFICVHPGTSVNFTGKRYREDALSALVDLLIERHDLPVFFTGNKSEKETVERIIGRVLNKKKVMNLAGALNLGEFMELLKQSHLLISGDTGPVHLAASLGVNVAVFYGPTSPRRYGPLIENSVTFYRGIDCSPCVGVSPLNRRCAAGFKCMDFAPKEVFEKITERFFGE